ncbi:MAG: hypothetical protein Q9218_006278 [Villophora microphyllina]
MSSSRNMPDQQDSSETIAPQTRSLAPKETYELQEIPGSPTRRARHHGYDEGGSHAVEKTSIDSHGSEIRDHASESFTLDEERAVVRKFDRHLVLSIALLYMLAFLDRSNIGNARIAGMSSDLSLTSSQYEWVLRSFYITYVLFEWMPILYTVLTPSTYVASCVLAWGIIASLQAFTTSYASLCVLRLLLGISEAAFSPGVPVYLAFFYKREELAYRIGLQISAAPLATSFASSLAWLIMKLGQNSAIAPWRMLFLVEGLPSVLVSAVAWFYLPDSPGEASMGYSALRSQILSAPPYLLAFFAVLLTSFYSDKFQNRSLFICFHACLAASGYASIAIAGFFQAGPMWRYWGVYPAACGFFSAVTLLITWTINNQESDAKKGTGVAILNVIGQLGPFIGTALYPESDKPYYFRGMTACALFMLLVAALSLWLRRILQRKNDAIGDIISANVNPLPWLTDAVRTRQQVRLTLPYSLFHPKHHPPALHVEAETQTRYGRSVVLKTGLTPSASGSAYFELEPSQPSTPNDFFPNASSSLKLTCTVHGPRPLPRSVPFSPHLLLSANVKFAPFASRHRRGYIRDVSERDLAVHVETALRGLLISERWPKSGVDVIITVLEGEDDGPQQGTGNEPQKEEGGLSGWGMMSVLSGCITVASAAIVDAGIDCVDLVSGGVAGIVRQSQSPRDLRPPDEAPMQIVLDPCPSEHYEILAVCVVGYLQSRDEVTEIWTRGGLGGTSVDEDSDGLGLAVLVDRAVEAAVSSRLVLEAALKEATEFKLAKSRSILAPSGVKRKGSA